MVNPSIKYPDSLLKFLQKEEQDIVSILFNDKGLININIEKELSSFLLPLGGLFQTQLNYEEILDRLLKTTKVNTIEIKTIQDKEEKILFYKFKNIIKNFSSSEKIEFEKKILKYAKENGISKEQVISISSISTLTIANLSGFSLYLMASTVVGGLTSILGITLPFIFYTSMSSVLAVITGPIGWAIGLGYLAYSFRNDNLNSAKGKVFNYTKSVKNKIIGNIEHTILIVSFLASCRIILKEENEKRKESLDKEKKDIENNIQNLNKKNIELFNRLEEIKNELSVNKKSIEKSEDKGFEINVKIKKIDNFIAQTLS